MNIGSFMRRALLVLLAVYCLPFTIAMAASIGEPSAVTQSELGTSFELDRAVLLKDGSIILTMKEGLGEDVRFLVLYRVRFSIGDSHSNSSINGINRATPGISVETLLSIVNSDPFVALDISDEIDALQSFSPKTIQVSFDRSEGQRQISYVLPPLGELDGNSLFSNTHSTMVLVGTATGVFSYGILETAPSDD